MIAVRLTGGLGNQLFHYATARSLSRRHHTKLLIDASWYYNVPHDETTRYYELDQCRVKGVLNTKTLWDGENVRTLSHTERLRLRQFSPFTLYKEPKFNFNEEVIHLTNNTLLSGDFQCENYFADSRKTLLKELVPAYRVNQVVKGWLNKVNITSNSVALHIRRGDYVTNKTFNKRHGLKTATYYKNAIDHIEKQVNKKLAVFIFSDDLQWCRRNLKFRHKTYYVEGATKSFDDLWLMSHCDHNVIANCSYSWWGAWLNQNSKKIVIAPKVWFVGGDLDSADVVPKEWVTL